MSGIVIVGSSRLSGDTAQVVKTIEQFGWRSIHLLEYSIGEYDYEHLNQNDDFLPLIRDIVENYNAIVLATPVYWYAMSGVMKTFIDRWTDVITIEKNLGRKLRGKQLGVITSSIGNNLGDDFWIPFKNITDYLGLDYRGNLHTIRGKIDIKKMVSFLNENSPKLID